MTCSKTDSESIEKISDVLKNGGIVILPTDTVYGFSGVVDLKGRKEFFCDDRIRQIKGRSETKPLIQLIAKPEDINLYTDAAIDPELLSKWPGPLTVIVPLKKDSPLKTDLKTIAFRCPGDEWLRKIIENCGVPLYSTSVNRSGSPVLCTEKEIISEFENECDLIVLAGDTENALPSTIVKVEEGKPYTVVRQGALKL
ncbi:L-threonylcarbamoyladenylate synthase [Treponema sp.]|jgi:L-threonylcarbamoyladenylate synthase|uniref:L-threonylcarbamoyladenylate synthase n=1 Tax=Treponema sp. TaxID=166 RepID=UPI001B289CBF|nr:L-threonylcarbamoyladenylate synthase [Treponema sp.]MBE6354429.1 threonylcarbamoyl-AMP synthase [Treponema sp.]MBO6177416.1 threonylcarbamoyl-AMP synthase [Treponema sp.]